jgi:NADPH:quinone reductase-like Zn-dependent oxidoreductase
MRFGGPDELGVVDAPPPTAGRGEVLVHVLASSVPGASLRGFQWL